MSSMVTASFAMRPGLRYPVLATSEPSDKRGMATARAASTEKHSRYPSSSTAGSSGKSTPARLFSSALLRKQQMVADVERVEAHVCRGAGDLEDLGPAHVGRRPGRKDQADPQLVGGNRRPSDCGGHAPKYETRRVNLRSMPSVIPSEFIDLLEGDALGHLATLRADGTPHVTPLWVDHDGDTLLVDVRVDRVKAANMRA